MNIKNIYTEAELYEAENSVMMKDLSFWEKTISNFSSGDVLEIGCGTGRIARYIIDSVHSYTGIDISPQFLEYFKKSECYNKNKKKITLVEIDYLNFETDSSYDLIMLSSQFLGHIYNNMELYLFLRRLSLMLKPKGKVVIDYCNPDIRFLNNRSEYEFCYQFEYDGNIRVFEKSIYNQTEQINYEYRKYLFSDNRELFQIIPFRIFFPQELDSLITLSGFNIEAKYGDYNNSYYEEYCNKQIYILGLN